MASHAFASFVCLPFFGPSSVPSSLPCLSSHRIVRLATTMPLVHSHCVYNRNPFILHFYGRNSFHFISFISLFRFPLFSFIFARKTHTRALTHHTTEEKRRQNWHCSLESNYQYPGIYLYFLSCVLFHRLMKFFRISSCD